MPFIPTFILTPTGLVATPYQVESLSAAVEHEPAGIYTVARTFQRDYVLLFDAHLDRLEQSAHLAGISLKLDRARLRAALREIVHQTDFANSKLRITVPAGQPDHLYLGIEVYQPVPDVIMQQGAALKIVPATRENPIVKTTTWMIDRHPTYSKLPPHVYYEGLMVTTEGLVLEGLSCNFFGVLDGVLYTAAEHILEGITRRAVLEFAPDILPVELSALHRHDLPQLAEAFISSSGRGVVPVTRIDQDVIGDGTIGPVVTAIMEQYDHWTKTRVEPL